MPSERWVHGALPLWALAGLVGLLGGCMDAADHTEAITGRAPPPVLAPVDAEVVDTAPPAVDAGVIDAAPDAAPPPDRCDGVDDDRDGRLDEDADLTRGAICCGGPGSDGPPCNDAEAGTQLPTGWAKVPGEGVLVMIDPLRWSDLAVSGLRDISVCASAFEGDDDPPIRGLDLYQATALANAWSCAVGIIGCYRIDGTIAELLQRATCDVAPPPPGATLTRDGECRGAELMSAGVYEALVGAAPGEVCLRCAGGSPEAVDTRLEDATGVRGLIAGRAWLWPGAPVVDTTQPLATAGCGVAAPCMAADIEPLAAFDSDWGLRLTCPDVGPGRPNLCTRPASGGACDIQ